MKAGQRRRMWTSGTVFVCASFKLSPCHCQDEACMRVCGCIYAWFRVHGHVSGAQYQVISPSPEPSGDFHILTFKQIFGGDQEKRITGREKEGKRERGREGGQRRP